MYTLFFFFKKGKKPHRPICRAAAQLKTVKWRADFIISSGAGGFIRFSSFSLLNFAFHTGMRYFATLTFFVCSRSAFRYSWKWKKKEKNYRKYLVSTSVFDRQDCPRPREAGRGDGDAVLTVGRETAQYRSMVMLTVMKMLAARLMLERG